MRSTDLEAWLRGQAVGLRPHSSPPFRLLIDKLLLYFEQADRDTISDEQLLAELRKRPGIGFQWLEEDAEINLNGGQQKRRHAMIGR